MAQAAPRSEEPRFLIVLCATGGASFLDGTLAIRASECATPGVVNTFPDALVTGPDGSPLRAVNLNRTALGPIPIPFSTSQSSFVDKHQHDMMMATCRRTSVSHRIGQARAVTGHDAWKGRTLQEATALAHGEGFAMPNVHLLSGSSFTKRGLDESLPGWCFGELVADARFWPLGFDAQRGLPGAPSAEVVEAARGLRSRLHALSPRAGARPQERTEHWRHLQGDRARALQAQSLADMLLLGKDSPDLPLGQYGYQRSPDAERLEQVFPKLHDDSFEAQAALAFLLLKHRLSVTVTLGLPAGVSATFTRPMELHLTTGGFGGQGPKSMPPPPLPGGAAPMDVSNPPSAFDFSHRDHRGTQAFLWARVYAVMDGLIDLLKGEEWSNGQSLWDRTMIYVATDFGRTTARPSGAEDFGSAHDFDSGALIVSPLANGNRVLGGVDRNTGATYGFDRATGEPDPGAVMGERDLYAGILQALAVDTADSGLPDMRAMRRSS